MRTVLVCGYYGAHNRGDELIFKVLSEALKEKELEVVVTSLDPATTSKDYGVHAIASSKSLIKGLLTFIKAVFGADAFILGGGGLYQDYGKHFRIVFYYGLRTLIAALLGKKIMYFALGFGNIELTRSKKFIQFVMQFVNVVTVRDKESKKVLLDIGFDKDIVVCADPVFTVASDKHALSTRKNMSKLRIGISVLPYDQQLQFLTGADENIEGSIIGFTKNLLACNHEITFIPMEKGTDDQFIAKILASAHLTDSVTVMDSSIAHDDFIGNFASFDVVIAMRLHAIILSAALGIPFLPIAYHSKVANTVSLLKQQDLMIPLELVSSVRLQENFDFLISSYDKRREIIIEQSGKLHQEALKLFDCLDAFLD